MTSSTPARLPTSQLFSLEGKTVIATGGTGGLGSEMCLAMAESGADIVSIYPPGDAGQSRLEETIRSRTSIDGGRKVLGFECDISDSQSLRDTFDKIWRAGVVPDILLNCAGLNRRGPIEEMTDEKIDLIFAVNLRAAYVAAQEFGVHLIKMGRPGKIINIASFTSFVAMTNVSAYAATKGGVLQMTKAFSNEWAVHGIQVNCICPGYIKTPLSEALVQQFPEMEQYIIDRTPAGRWGKPADLRGAVLFLASPASDYVTGTSIVVDGGMMFR
ncbi:hypothetical protein LTR20_009989 [Exophiala xenobiotica]|nr:hypothetical protein LTS13_009412 [Exophiala xenobiotica]KAK5392152.1 hypothetical protein LTR79_010562 [Exophiala xenobiotica]KAK5407703.1 hypothetical protein LTR90_009879 [Exophiala xenobiotica]KAK5454750.1 hypothetical protein LTR20_009989 [Exophiala xenobiotica]KAK5498339.1 hypothetical protein LTR26_001740 [Exophiala xenobiotica]